MALGDSYPVELLDDQGNRVATEVAAVQFTDGADQPSTQPPDWINVYAQSSQPLTTTAQTPVVFGAADDPPAIGTSVSWVIGTPDTITINADGTYDVAAMAQVGIDDVEDPSHISGAQVTLNDSSVGPFYWWAAPIILAPGIAAVGTFSFPGVALHAGDVLKLTVQAQDANKLTVTSAAFMVKRTS